MTPGATQQQIHRAWSAVRRQHTTRPTSGRADRPLGLRALAVGGRYGTIIVLALMCLIFGIASPGAFGTMENVTGVLTNLAPAAIVAGGLTMCLVAGDFDLSIGYQASIAGVLVVGLLNGMGFAGLGEGGGLPIAAAAAVVLGFGAFFGLVNGLVVTRFGVNAFIATLGTGTIILAMNYWYGGGVTFPLDHGEAFTGITLNYFLGIEGPIWIMAGALAALWVVLNLTVLGQHIKAIGDDEEAARRLGIKVERTRVWAFVICGVYATGGGVLLASALGSADSTAGDVYLLQSFAAAFLGSAALRDGEFHIIGTVIGGITVAIGFNGLAIFSAPVFTQYLFSGGLLITAVALSTLSRRYAADV